MLYRFETISLDTERRELRRADAMQHVEPQVFDLLVYLIRNRERVVSRDELFKEIWRDRAVSDAVLSSRIHAARAAIGDTGAEQRLIRTLRTKGLRFVGMMHEQERPPAAQLGGLRDQAAGVLAERPALAVLPFAVLNGGDSEKCVADAISDALIIGLSKTGWLSVASRASALACNEKKFPAREIARQLGVRYVLEGGVCHVGERVRVTARLIDAIADHQIWTQRFECQCGGAFALQDDIADCVLRALEPHLYFAEELRARRRPLTDLNAWECIVRSLSLINSRDKAAVQAACALLKRAVGLDAFSAQARALLSIATTLRLHMGWSTRSAAVHEARALARLAFDLDPNEPWAHVALGYATIWLQPQEAIRPLQRAIELNANSAVAHYFLALAATYGGIRELVFVHAGWAERLAHRDLLARAYAGAHDNVRATASFAEGRYDEGIEFARSAVRELPRSPSGYRALTINLALAGDLPAAASALNTLRRLTPETSLQWNDHNHGALWARSDAAKRYREAFRAAGLT